MKITGIRLDRKGYGEAALTTPFQCTVEMVDEQRHPLPSHYYQTQTIELTPERVEHKITSMVARLTGEQLLESLGIYTCTEADLTPKVPAEPEVVNLTVEEMEDKITF